MRARRRTRRGAVTRREPPSLLPVRPRRDVRLPVSVKGIVTRGQRILVLRNGRGEWELPGGRLGDGESPEEALRREMQEETGLRVEVRALVDAWVYRVGPRKRVCILEYVCRFEGERRVTISREHSEHAWLPAATLMQEPIPEGYLRGILRSLGSPRKII